MHGLVNSFFGLIKIICIFSVGIGTQIDFSNSNHGFSIIWNTPYENCLRYGVELRPVLEKFGIRVNKKHGLKGETIVLFYKHDMGLYPYFDNNGTSVNGGLPQVRRYI